MTHFNRIITWGLYYIFRPFVRVENIIYSKIKKKNNRKIRRLFATTGNISLVNSLAIINEIGDFEKYDDTLIVNTGKGGKDFFEKQKEIASLHKFKIIDGVGIFASVIAVLNNQFAFDEVYMLNHPLFIKTLLPLYPKSKIILIDEGCGSLIDYGISDFKNIKKLKTHKYINKINFLSTNEIYNNIFEPIDIQEFRKIALILSQKSPIVYENNNAEKYILYCGIYWEGSGFTKEKFVKIQSNMINELIDAGYKILYKPHPRDNEYFGFDKNPNVQFINCLYPIELYELDIIALFSIASTASLSYAHYWDIPCFSNIYDEVLQDDSTILKVHNLRKIIREYSPNYRYLLQFDVKNISKDELKKQIKNCYKKFINEKPLLSENEIFKAVQEQ